MSTGTKEVVYVPGPMVLHGVTYRQYVAFRKNRENRHTRMTYYDGTLEMMSPEYIHESPAVRIGQIVRIVATAFEIPYEGVRTSTVHSGPRDPNAGRRKGQGKEPDESFYFVNAPRIIGKETIDLDAGDPPPDLWIEVDNRSSSKGRLPLYAALGVPEVWRYRVQTSKLWFGRLTTGQVYEPIDRSLALPMLTPELVCDALALGEGVLESEWARRLQNWVREHFKNHQDIEED